MNTATPRNETLDSINQQLRAHGLKVLKKLGNSTKGEIEVTAIKEIYDHSVRFFTDVKFAVIFPSGKEGEFTIRFNANGCGLIKTATDQATKNSLGCW